MNKLIELHRLLQSKYPTFTGVTKQRDGSVMATYSEPPTKELADQVDADIAAFDWTETPEPTDSEIKDRLSRLTTEEKDRLLAALLENAVLSNPALLEKVTANVRVNR